VRYISLFSGIGGFDLGLDQAGMECILQVEQDKFALEVLHRHWPNVPKITDVKEVTADAIKALGANRDGLLVAGGFPCTGMSIAGKREGFRDPRSGLWMEFHRILSEVQPEYALIENVPGLFSSNKGRDFAVLLRGLETIGYSDIAWRVLDSQHWVPQRRKRVFILARHTPTVSGRCAEILFEQSSLRRDTKKGGQEGQETPGESKENSGGNDYIGDQQQQRIRGVNKPSAQLTSDRNSTGYYQVDSPNDQYNAYSVADRIRGTEGVASTLSSQGGGTGAKTGLYHIPDLARTIRPSIEGKNAWNSDGTGNMIVQDTTGTLTQSYDGDQSAGDTDKLVVQDTCGTLSGGAHPSGFNGQDAYTGNVVGYAVTSKWAKGSGGPSGSASETNNCVQTTGAVRRLTPVECARLQGFPDDWNEEVSDAQRYKQFGNAVTVPVAKWIGERILKCSEK
jgi:DNA (cytosine-5)-methyltransferase 1